MNSTTKNPAALSVGSRIITGFSLTDNRGLGNLGQQQKTRCRSLHQTPKSQPADIYPSRALSPVAGWLRFGRLDGSMPDRLIRAAILTSDPVNKLSWAAEVFFRRLMSVVDDFGRYDGRPSILRASLFPLKLSSVSEPDVVKWMSECSEAALVRAYVVENKSYVEIVKFDQRLRAHKSKWPAPVDLLTSDSNRPHSAAECGSRVDSVHVSESVSSSGMRSAEEKGFPSLEQVKQKAQFIGMPEADAVEFWHHFESTGWIDRNGHSVASWQSKMVTWKIKHQEVNGAKRPPSVLDLRTVIEAKEFKAAELKKNYCSEAAMGETWNDPNKLSEWKKLRREVREIRDKLSNMA